MNINLLKNPATWISLGGVILSAAASYFPQHVSLATVITTAVLALANILLANQNEKQAVQLAAHRSELKAMGRHC